MKYLYLSSLFLIVGFVSNAQLSVVPQLGIENSKTTVSYNQSSGFAPIGTKLSPQAALRLDYKFKKGHGPFVGFATTRSGVNYTFTNPETGRTNYMASRDNMQLRLEGGYQLTTKPIYFNKSGSKKTNSNASAQKSPSKSGCRDFYITSRCGSKSFQSAAKTATKQKGSWVAFQPSAGMAFVPTGSAAGIATNGQGDLTTYEYTAGNWKTALVAGTGFIFGKNDRQKLVVSINYLRGIGNQSESMTTTNASKPVTTNISSNSSNWNLRVGVPFSLTKTRKPSTPKEVIIIRQRTEIKQPAAPLQQRTEKKCGSMYRCRKTISL